MLLTPHTLPSYLQQHELISRGEIITITEILPPNGGCHYFRLNKEGELLDLRLNYQIDAR